MYCIHFHMASGRYEWDEAQGWGKETALGGEGDISSMSTVSMGDVLVVLEVNTSNFYF